MTHVTRDTPSIGETVEFYSASTVNIALLRNTARLIPVTCADTSGKLQGSTCEARMMMRNQPMPVAVSHRLFFDFAHECF
jgi:hypothetical protein